MPPFLLRQCRAPLQITAVSTEERAVVASFPLVGGDGFQLQLAWCLMRGVFA